ncbi:MAG TPA: hypothetical protein DEO84_03285 [candidate division Zixibacteria bacterium]|nr:hypothetical protein [candidate division Zixibacteria bacterium]HBZ00325.1 hypothetical protein [candidate division Zixibacteria bacterium]
MVKTKLSFLDKLNMFVSIYGQLFISIFRFSWWSPFFIYAIFQTIGFLALLWYYAPILSSTVYPIISLFLPPNAFHYPQYYLALPSLYATYESLILGITVWIVLAAAAVYRFSGIYNGKVPALRDSIRLAMRSYLPLLLVWLLETVLVIIILYLPSHLLKNMIADSPNRAALADVVFETIGLGVTAMLIYAVPGIILDGKKVWQAIQDSIGLFMRNFIFTYSIVFFPSFLRIIMNLLLTSYAPKIITILNPELIPTIMFIYIFAGIFINLFIYGAAVFAYKRMAD